MQPSSRYGSRVVKFLFYSKICFKDTRTLHAYDNEPIGRELHIKAIHDLNLFSSLISTFDENDQKLFNTPGIRYSITDGFILFMTDHNQYLKFLAFVRRVNPLAKVMIFSRTETFASAQQLMTTGWNRFKLVRVIYFVDTEKGKFWLLYNPFENKFYNLVEIAQLDLFLNEYLSCKDVRGFPVKVLLIALFRNTKLVDALL